MYPPLCIRIQVPHHGECLAAALRGRIEVESAPGKGASFTLYFPALAVASLEPATLTAAVSLPGRGG